MGRTITLDVPEPLFLRVSSVADERGLTPADWIVDQLAEQLEAIQAPLVEANHPQADESEESEHDDPFRKLFGSFGSGDPDSCNNEKIDADLAREYGRGLRFED